MSHTDGNPAENTPNEASSIRLPPFDHSLSEDEVVVHKFMQVIQSKVERGLLGPLYENEKKVLLQSMLNPGFYIGSITAVTTFVVLRKAPIYIMNRYFIPYYNQPSSIFVKVNNPPTATSSTFTEPRLLQPLSIVFDAVMSTLVGLTAWITSVDKPKIYKTMEEIPLMPGRSHLSDVLCDDFIHLYRHEIPKSFWIENEDDILTTITRVVENCEKRRAFEQQIRQQQKGGIADSTSWGDWDMEESESRNDFISLPSPVPPNILEHCPGEGLIQVEEEIVNWAEADDFEDDDFKS